MKKQSNSKKPLVGIVIVNWNKKDMTADCLKSLKMTTYPNYKVILIDNGSTDGSVEYLRKINPSMHIIVLNKNYGYTEGTNIGWKYALDKLKADYVCAMDNDIVTIQKEWLDLIIKETESSPKIGIGSGKHLFPDGRLQTPFLEADMNDSNKPDTGKYDFVKRVAGYVGPGIVIKRKVIEKIGFYDENFFYGPNDIDYCYRATKAGFDIVYTGLSKSVHIGSASGMSPMRDLIYRHQTEGMMIFSFRYDPFYLKVAMVIRQFIRAFVTRLDPISPRVPGNFVYHRNLHKRIPSYFKSLYLALISYRKIKSSESSTKISKIIC